MIIDIIFLYSSLILIHFPHSMLFLSSCFAPKYVWVGCKPREYSKFVMLCGILAAIFAGIFFNFRHCPRFLLFLRTLSMLLRALDRKKLRLYRATSFYRNSSLTRDGVKEWNQVTWRYTYWLLIKCDCSHKRFGSLFKVATLCISGTS